MSDFNLALIYRILKPFEKNRLKKVEEVISGSGLAVLEIGCSDGRFLYENKNKWRNITGVDIDEDKLEKARKQEFGIPAKFLNVDFGKKPMPFRDSSIDLVVSIATLQYIYDLDLLFNEIFRVLKKGGHFIFEVPNIAVFWRRIQFLWGIFPRTSTIRKGWDADIIHYFTFHDLEIFVSGKGFVIEKVSCSGILDGLRQYWVSFLGADLIFICRKPK